jgi:phosphoribosylaminoimidazole-succinocarboxamide synthase
MKSSAVTETNLGIGPLYRGKVRDCYRLDHSAFGPAMLIVSTDRISAFDWILPTPIPDKGKVLTAISAFWFDWLSSALHPQAHHLLTTDVDAMGLPASVDRDLLRGRSMLVRQAEVIPFECVVRGWLAGSGLVEYRRNGTVCGVPLPAGLGAGSPLPEPIFTPATKAETGHDENVSFDVMADRIGRDLAARTTSHLAKRLLWKGGLGCNFEGLGIGPPRAAATGRSAASALSSASGVCA